MPLGERRVTQPLMPMRWLAPVAALMEVVLGYGPNMLGPGEYAGWDLAEEMRHHLEEPFPATVMKGESYGEVNSVLIGADVYGWALRASRGEALPLLEFERLRGAADALDRSIAVFPRDAQPYYERVLRIARLALQQADK
jgi:hypothetical protein